MPCHQKHLRLRIHYEEDKMTKEEEQAGRTRKGASGRVEVRGSQRGNGRERNGWGLGGDGVREQMQGGGGTTLAAVPPVSS